MGFQCRIYVGDDEIYAGDFGEVPEEFRKKITDDLTLWAGSLGKGGLNELLYSHLYWYVSTYFVCRTCVYEGGDGVDSCPECGGALEERHHYARHEKLDLIMSCIGSISKIEVVRTA
ncbi:MAG: hypothetical protein IH874_01280 [Candidatus Dadabacteria bacterium]|nr:hypothetical protein [Candidatus Dadabacteria bacterium]